MHRRMALILGFVLVTAACGGGDDVTASSTTSTSTAAASTTGAPESTTTTTTDAVTTTDAGTTTGAPTTTAATTTTTEEPAGTSSPLAITKVDFDEEWVEITNVSDAEYSLDGHFICNFPGYASIADVGRVAAGESFTVELSLIGAGSATGEIALYTASDFSNPDAMVTYVEWGTPNHARSSVAVQAGLWTAGDFVDNGHASFQALTTGGSSEDYELVFE